MSKKIILACMAMAAFAAFVIPATASASPRLCETTSEKEPCVNVEVGKKIRGHNVGNWTLNGGVFGNIVCSTVSLTGTLRKNNGTHIEGDIETGSFGGTGAGGDCTSPIGDVRVTPGPFVPEGTNGLPWCLTAGGELGADKFTTRGNSCAGASRSITFILDFTGGPTCYYNREPKVEGSFTTDTATGEDAVLTFSEAEWKLEKGENESFLKPCLGSGKLNGAATLETDVEGTSPLYIK